MDTRAVDVNNDKRRIVIHDIRSLTSREEQVLRIIASLKAFHHRTHRGGHFIDHDMCFLFRADAIRYIPIAAPKQSISPILCPMIRRQSFVSRSSLRAWAFDAGLDTGRLL